MTSDRFIMPVLFVGDINKSKAFYQQVFSLEIKHDFGENIVFEQNLSLWDEKRANQIIYQKELQSLDLHSKKHVELYFETTDIYETWKKIMSLDVEIIHELKEESWGQRTIRMYDPDNYIIEVAEPMEMVIKRLHETTKMSVDEISRKTQLPIESVREILS